jgi:hypothetical protein
LFKSQTELTSQVRDYQYLKICPEQIEQVNLVYAAKYPTLASAEPDVEADRRTIAKFLGGKRVRRKHFLELCKLLGVAPLTIAGLQSGLAQTKEIPALPQELRNADFEQVLEFMMRQKQLGRIVQLTDHNSNICHYVSKELTPERLGGADPQKVLKNHNYLESWEKTGSLEGYLKMRSLLEKDGYIPGYVHQLIRPSDGALGEYSSDFYLVRDLLGRETRMTSSNPKDYHVISF